MGKNSIFLWRFLVAFAVLFCNTFAADALLPPRKLLYRTVCRAGEYISKCGDYYVGTNWLKGYTKSSVNIITEGTSSTEQVYTQKTPDYFDYSDNANEVNMENLRKFFTIEAEDLQTIYYTPKTGDQEAQVENNATPSEFTVFRDEILNKFCDPSLVTIKCAPCPGNGTTSEESEYVIKNGRRSSWTSFNTIAHCYMTTYNDTTGTYINIDSNSTDDSQKGKECYFVNDVNYVGGSVLDQSDTNN